MQKQLMRLKMLRMESKLSQEKIANKIGIHRNTYNDKENGYHPFTHWEVNKILECFQLPYEEIFLKEERRDYSHGTR